MTDIELRREFATVSERLFNIERQLSNYADSLHSASVEAQADISTQLNETQDAVDYLLMK